MARSGRARTARSLSGRSDSSTSFGLSCRLGYSGVAAGAWAAWRRGDATPPERPVLLTFDDGYADLVECALPILHRFGWGATVFVAASTVGGRSVWDEPEPRPTASCRRTRSEPGPLGASSSALTGQRTATSHGSTRQRLQQEVVGGRDALAELLGRPVTAFAYPYGSHNDEVRELVADSFEIAFGTEEGLNDGETDRARGSGARWFRAAIRR